MTVNQASKAGPYAAPVVANEIVVLINGRCVLSAGTSKLLSLMEIEVFTTVRE